MWNDLWNTSPYGDVLFAALEFYAPVVRKRASAALWPVLRGWSSRVDNWCHCDGLSALYSRLLESYPKDVYPQLVAWNDAGEEWLRRISLVSLIHYTGKNAVFLPPLRMGSVAFSRAIERRSLQERDRLRALWTRKTLRAI